MFNTENRTLYAALGTGTNAIDLTTLNSFSLTLVRPKGRRMIKPQADLTVGTTELVDQNGATLAAPNTYASYVFQASDYTEELPGDTPVGTWRAYYTYEQTAGVVRVARAFTFQVEALGAD